MWQRIKSLIKRLFNRSVAEPEQGDKSDEFVNQYKDLTYNLTAIAANKISNLVITESNVDVGRGEDEENERIKFFNDFIQKVWAKAKKITAQALGIGGVALVPYCEQGTLYFDIVQQNRMFINSVLGDNITGVSFLSDIQIIDEVKYSRFTFYEITDEGCVIKNKATKNDSQEVPLNSVPAWMDIEPEVLIPNCTKVPVAYLKCPTDNRNSNDLKGVPITFGCEDTIKEIKECLKQIQREYAKKKAVIFADSTMFSDKDEVDKDLYMTFMGGSKLGDGSLIDIFNPDIRDTAYKYRLESLYERLESEIGATKGIFTKPDANYATATQINRYSWDTHSIVWNMCEQWKKTMRDMLDAAIVIADYFGLVPYSPDSIPIKFDWSYGMVENSETTWMQLSEGHSRGVISDPELRQFLIPSETLKQAQEVISTIKTTQPKVEDLFEYDIERTTTEAS